MSNIFTEVRVLRQEGKLHTKLISRTRMLFGISLVLGAIVAFNVVFRNAHIGIVSLLAAIGFILGLYVFSRMTAVQWNEEESLVQTGRMDTIGFVSLGLHSV